MSNINDIVSISTINGEFGFAECSVCPSSDLGPQSFSFPTLSRRDAAVAITCPALPGSPTPCPPLPRLCWALPFPPHISTDLFRLCRSPRA
jgi:hypothetical protein